MPLLLGLPLLFVAHIGKTNTLYDGCKEW